jgi:hypothetical protein
MSQAINPEGDNARESLDSSVSTPPTTDIGLAALHRVEHGHSPTTYQAIRDVARDAGLELTPREKNDLRHAVDLAREKLEGEN